jgi:iron transport multicopper oxidase
LQAGLAIQLIEAPLVAQQRLGPPQKMYDNCQALGLPFKGNAAGNENPDDLSGLTVGPFQQNLGWHSRGIGAMAG